MNPETYERITGQRPPDTLPQLEKEAGVLLRLLLPGHDASVLEKLAPYQEALAFQILALERRGAAAFSREESFDSVSLGKFHYSKGSAATSGSSGMLDALGLSPLSVEILKQSGLLYRGAVVLGG